MSKMIVRKDVSAADGGERPSNAPEKTGAERGNPSCASEGHRNPAANRSSDTTRTEFER